MNDIEALEKISLPVLGMTCAGCAASVQSMIAAQPGVNAAEVNYATQSVHVTYQPSLIRPQVFQAALQGIGYDLILDQEKGSEQQEEVQSAQYHTLKKRSMGAGILTLPIVIIGMFFMEMPYGNIIMLLLTTPVLFLFGRNFFSNAWKQARHGRANMDSLVALSTGIAYLFSVFNTIYPEFWYSRGLQPHVYFEAAAVIIVFIMLGRLLEENAKSNTSAAIKKLIGLQPKTVHLMTANGAIEIEAAAVQKGNVLLVRPGEKIAVDGAVISGTSYVDESMISGEPVAVLKEAGAKVFAGTINQKGSFQFKADKVGNDTMLAQIIQLVQQAQGSKAPVQKLVDKVAGIFVPIVMGIALFTLVLWLIFGGNNGFSHGLMAMVTVLVIACPCALGLATPTAIMVGIGKGAETGILIKDAEALETGYKVNAVILDKTGTLTEGKPVLDQLHWAGGYEGDHKTLEQVLYTLEKHSEHPLAEAVVHYFNDLSVKAVEMSDFESLTGRGIKGVINGQCYYVGSHRMLTELNIQIPNDLALQLKQLEGKEQTVVYFTSEKEVFAIMTIADKIKPGSKKAVEALQAQGISVYMLTGDNQHTAAAIAAQTGITHFKAEVLPADKADFVKALQANGKVVAMIGDGINDSQALAQADLSVAMGKGADIAIDVAKITLMSSDLLQVPKALRLSALTVKTIRQNLFWAFIYNIIGIPLAAGILYPVNEFLLNPMIAGAAMALSSVSVVSNSLRLKFAKLI